MDLMEYQGKELFRSHGIPTTPRGEVTRDAAEAERLAAGFGGPVMVKAQVLTGGRGKAGGVKYCPDPSAAREAAEAILGLDISGHTTELVLVEPASDIAEEYYLSVLHDRVTKGYLVIASVEGGVEIEEVNRRTPEKVVKAELDPTRSLSDRQAREILEQAQFPAEVVDEAASLLTRLHQGFVASDATLFEINPLIKTTEGRVIALDSKVSIDGSALFRHPELEGWGDVVGGDSREAQAQQKGLQYVELDGDIGVMGNGAGLVMATLDVVNEAGGHPANFLDAGGGASAESMATGIAFVLENPEVSAMLVNIFGGITRCDDVAHGVLGAIEQIGGLDKKLVVRLDGTNADAGRDILEQAGNPNLVPAEKMDDAAQKVVELAGESR
ncbi:ADP-forming succinate--CoA ligase subunit beta [Egibacter rhizosphaerae]|uniref:Succinate--CoA ligase [ADP-forming] subunit beta n=1 Tax=Egibacter rhizosphaerae TaxID=1670831 RepID=A0A411YHP6_9ACTN|nr:ADP-forming succinate--CoA ligase subunit beta [Egibacter rhizosphaerae]QBI20602.1 ADP-forming succinate--CoA ligase subunit beta [Egibacter rhizosphaerae]